MARHSLIAPPTAAAPPSSPSLIARSGPSRLGHAPAAPRDPRGPPRSRGRRGLPAPLSEGSRGDAPAALPPPGRGGRGTGPGGGSGSGWAPGPWGCEPRADMSAKGCLGCAKCLLFLLNLFFFFLGILLLAFSFWVLFDRQSFAAVLGSPLAGLRLCSYGLSGVGTAAMLLGFLGCLGALKELRALLGLYFGLLLLLLAAQVTVAIIVYTQRAALAAKVAAYAEELIRGYPAQGPPADPQESWDAVQQQLGCCGWKGPQDWEQRDEPSGDGDRDRTTACSCLRTPNSTHGTPWLLPHGRCPAAAPQDIFPRGCEERVQSWLAANLVTIVGVCVGIGLGELSLLMLSMFLVRNLDSRYKKLLRGF